MKKIFFSFSRKTRNRFRQDKHGDQLERGQVLVIVALSVIALTAIVGLTVDVGLIYLNHGKLRRAVDAAALAATAQFREGYDINDYQKAAEEFLVLNGINDPTAIVEICDPNNPDPAICSDPPRKLVRVHATATVKLAFMPVIGIHVATVSATAVSEAASMDVVLVLDASESMTYGVDSDDPMYDPSQCNPAHDCHPFEEVKTAAAAFVEELYFPYDRVAIVTFDDSAFTELGFSANKADILGVINGLEVVEPDICEYFDNVIDIPPGPCRQYERYPDSDTVYGNNNGIWEDEPIIDEDGDGVGDTYLGFDCPVFRRTGNPDTCPTTAIGQGLLAAGNEYANEDTFREEALWVVILLTDGAANAPSFYCPHSTWLSPFCRDTQLSRHCYEPGDLSCTSKGGAYQEDDSGVSRYDDDDYARDMADFVAEDQKALIFTIGLGNLVRESIPRSRINDPTQKCNENPPDPPDQCYGAGEQLMRYAADVGGGKYYFAPTGNQLRAIFLEIAQYLATRLTQ